MTTLTKPVRRVAQKRLDGFYGPDRGKRIVVTLLPGNSADVADLIELRPERTRRGETIALIDVYRYAIMCRTNKQHMEKMRARKAKKAEQRQRAQITRTRRKLFESES